jgi:DNA polymerase eta
MQRKLGGDSRWLYDLIRGIDRSEGERRRNTAYSLLISLQVKEKPALVKSMLASKNLQKPITRVQDGPHWIRVLAAELHLRLKDAQEIFPGLWPKSLVCHLRAYPYTTIADSPIMRPSGPSCSRG